MTNLSDPFKYSFDRLEDVADHISEVLQCPITIEDVNHKLLAYSTHSDCTDPARTSTIIGRRVPEKVINKLWKDGTIPALHKTDQPIRVKEIDEVGLSNRVAISIWKNNQVLGFIWALEIQKTLSDDDLLTLQMAAKAVRNKLLNLQIRKTKNEERSQEFFWKMLTGHIHEESEMAEGFHKLGMAVPPVFSVMIIRLQSEMTEKKERQLQYLQETTQQVHVLLATADYNELIILTAPKNDQPFKDLKQFAFRIQKQLTERYKLGDASIAFGGIYESISNVYRSYQEALAVLKAKERFVRETKHLFSFSELGIYQYLDVLDEKRKHTGYFNYSLAKLEQYDQEHQSNLVETLERFIDADSNVNTAAKALNIHVNTLNYRLKRISQIAEFDLKNINEKFTMYLDIKLRNTHL
ncbi:MULTISPECIES: PucR family transcriptional regulator [Bacillus]|uniref:PucR family transcriptional regulator n=1 Tax=Bacillus TaxID=1386 RepID=UPI000779AC52|nr:MULTISPECIES: PucR family transcriptional regulator [Bacillus]MBT2627073.1 PucR family transcriptional regulator [Bacillus sp. ISL-32]MCI3195989.1 PucR family transcriptional regulator [Bacillus sp. HU-1818]MCY8515224.1 PucR family transcriptional regulator [Bacillus atrophaeus]MCY8825278.1 PucR family transcriptional regulator [Bacillus atrophaeus]MCY8839650.1 PucR family transcriptional regulator [Bacillus atrophaeus]